MTPDHRGGATAQRVTREIFISAPPSEVYRALTTPSILSQWWGSSERYTTSEWKMDPRRGGVWSCRGRSAAGNEYSLHGRVIEARIPERLVYTWNASWSADPRPSIVTFDLEASGNGTRLRVTHDFPPEVAQDAAQHARGWTEVLEWLRKRWES